MSAVSVVVLTHQRAAEAARTAERLLALPEAPPVIVVDNASSDGTASTIRARLPSVRLLALSVNLGAAARNVGVLAAATDYVALCDDDTWWAPGALARAVAMLDAHPRLAVVTGRVLVGADGHEDPTCTLMATSPLEGDPDCPGPRVLGFLAGAAVAAPDRLPGCRRLRAAVLPGRRGSAPRHRSRGARLGSSRTRRA